MSKRIAIVYAAHDGFTSLYTGVGTLARDFLLAFPEVRRQIGASHKDVDLTLYVATIRYGHQCFGFSEEVKAKSLAMADEHEFIHLVELENGSDGKESYGTIDNWRQASQSAARLVQELSQQYDQVLCIAVDTPFAQTPNLYLREAASPSVRFMWLPQSTVRIHRYGKSSVSDQQGNAYEQERYIWEREVVDLANDNPKVQVACAGEFMRQHLLDDYGATENSLIMMQNSLYLPRLEQNKISQQAIAGILKRWGVPTDKKLLFSFGRAEPYKGLDLVLNNVDELISEQEYYVLVLASPYSMEDPYLKTLDELAAKHPDNIKLLYDLDFMTPHYIMQWHNTKILAILSRAEPFGIIPIESRYYHNRNLALLVSNRDGFTFQIKDNHDGFLTELDNRSIRSALRKISHLSAARLNTVSDAGFQKIVDDYSQVKVDTELLKQYLFNADAFTSTLSAVGRELDKAEVVWCLGSSSSLYVQGVAVVPRDIDIIVDNRDVAKARVALETLQPSEPQEGKFGQTVFRSFPLSHTDFPAEVASFDIEFDVIERIKFKDISVPVHSLGFELKMYQTRPGKADTVKLIEEQLRRIEHAHSK